MSGTRYHSFDAPRDRPAPRFLRGLTLDGESWTREITERTLIVAVKPDCDGCREFVEGDVHPLASLAVVVVSKTGNDDWKSHRRSVFVSPDAFTDLLIHSAPFYVLVDPETARVVCEGSVFSAAQVAEEIAAYEES
ncbi:MAG TPA: hypothetical protein VGG21_04840 [Acidimicrobiales bacterium]